MLTLRRGRSARNICDLLLDGMAELWALTQTRARAPASPAVYACFIDEEVAFERREAAADHVV
jgi:hypothetical protein